MKRMKGIELPFNMIVIMAVAVLLLVSLSFFFSSSVSQFGSESEARTYLVSTCRLLRCGYDTSAELKENYQKFYDACKSVLPEAEEKPYQCLQQCGCDASVSEEEVQQNINEFVSILKKID